MENMYEKKIYTKKVVLSGLQAFANEAQDLGSLVLDEVIRKLSKRKTPLLGICLGAQHYQVQFWGYCAYY